MPDDGRPVAGVAQSLWSWLAPALAWLSLMSAALATRPLVPVPETRYVSIAWEMWDRGSFLVPYLNGAAYSDKPPLLFWLMHMGWAVFGVNAWWPRVVAAFFSLTTVYACMWLARLLWPQRPAVARHAPLLMAGTVLWLAYATLVMFDPLVTTLTVLAAGGLVLASRGAARAWWLVGAATGLGLLAKGPVIFIYTLPLALLAPWWSKSSPVAGKRRWYAGVLGSAVAGIAIVALWVVPAAIRGGPAYTESLLWHQAAGRVISSFAHAQPWWWYLWTVPLAMLPWSAWPAVWRGAGNIRAPARDAGVRFCIAWIVPAFVVLSLISGKQIHYMLPLFPALACLAACALDSLEAPVRALRIRVPAVLLALLGVVVATAPHSQRLLAEATWLSEVSSLTGLSIVLLGVALFTLRPMPIERALGTLMLSLAAAVIVVHVGVIRVARPVWDVSQAASVISKAQAEGRPVAHLWRYYDQYQFEGRLHRPLEILYRQDIAGWAERHPRGLIVGHHNWCGPTYRATPIFSRPLRGEIVDIWESPALAADPSLAWAPCTRN